MVFALLSLITCRNGRHCHQGQADQCHGLGVHSATAAMPIPTWREYIHNVLLASGYVSDAGIYGVEGKRWAASSGVDLSVSEIQTLVKGFVDPNKLRSPNGLLPMGDMMYTCTRADSRVIVGRSGPNGCVIYRCKTCLLFGMYEDGNHPGGCYNMIMKLGDYLRDKGY